MHQDDGRLHAYLDGELDDRALFEIEAHLARCPACTERLDVAARERALASALIGELSGADVTAPAWEALVAQSPSAPGPRGVRPTVRAPRAAAPPPAPGSWGAAALAWAATLILAFAIGWQANRPLPIAPPADPAQASRGLDADPPPALPPPPPTLPEEPAPGVVEARRQRPERSTAVAERLAAVSEAEPVPAETPSAAPSVDRKTSESATPPSRFVVIDAADAAQWLGAPPLRVVGAALLETAVGPSSARIGQAVGGVVLRTIWDLGSGARVTLLQEHEPSSVTGADGAAVRLGDSREAALQRRVAAESGPANAAGGRDLAGVIAISTDAAAGETRVTWRPANGGLATVYSRELDAVALRELIATIR